MDTTDPEILFDQNGVCSHCYAYDRRLQEDLPPGDRNVFLRKLLDDIKNVGKQKDYDCIIGVSGGIDSTYVAWLCKRKFGLRPLAIHFDNGWNTELAIQNIEATLRALDIDLHTHVVDWEEFRDLQLSFLKSSISDWEIPTDHAIRALLYTEAARRGIKYIITGSNLATEAVMPSSWGASNIDLRLLTSIHKRFGAHKLKTMPRLSILRLAWYTFARGIRQIPILNYVDYRKDDVSPVLERELGWRPYAFKHGESLFTKFFQRHYMPVKFGYDKRKPHLSNLILSGQIDRDQAMGDMNAPLYYPEELERDKAYVAKKLGLSVPQLDEYVAQPPRHHSDYPNSDWIQKKLPDLVRYAKRAATARHFAPSPRSAGLINLHIYPSPITWESRILRITAALSEWSLFDRIVIVGMQGPGLPEQQLVDEQRSIERIRTPFKDSQWLPSRLARFVGWYLAVIRRFRREPVACINCHSLSTLPLGWLLKLLTGGRLIYDTHELETETMGMKGIRRSLARLVERSFIRKADAIFVVGPKIAEWYRQHYPGLTPSVLRNLPDAITDASRQNLFRERLGLPDDALIFFYQGVLAGGRGVEVTLAAFSEIEGNRHVVFLGYGPLEGLVQDKAREHSNIHYLPAVPPHELRNYTLSGDVGLCMIEPACLSYEYCLPNKLFEYLAAGVPVIATELPDVSAVIAKSGAGWTTRNTPEALREIVLSITRSEATLSGQRGLKWSTENSWERERESMKQVYIAIGN